MASNPDEILASWLSGTCAWNLPSASVLTEICPIFTGAAASGVVSILTSPWIKALGGGVGVSVGVKVAVEIADADAVGVIVGVFEAVDVGVEVPVAVGVLVGVAVGVMVGV